MRGLAYYTGVVFEVFDRSGKFRAIAGGGRYDNLIAQLSDGAASLPAIGFAMGDVVLGEMIADVPAARERMAEFVRQEKRARSFISSSRRRNAAPTRFANCNYCATPAGASTIRSRPRKSASNSKPPKRSARKMTLLFGDEWPAVKMKTLATREELLVPHEELLAPLSS